MHPDLIEQLARERISGMLDDAARDRLARATARGRQRTPRFALMLTSAFDRLLDLARLVRRPRIAVEDQPKP